MKRFWSSWRFLTAVTALVVAVGVFGDAPSAQQSARARRDENFDIRSDPKSAGTYRTRVGADPSIGAPLADARAAGIARLKADHSAIDLENSPLTGSLEIVGATPGTGFLTGPGADRVGAMRGFLSQYADAYGVSQGQVQELALVADYVNPAGNMAWVEFEQRINGIPVFQGLVRGGFTKTGELTRITGPLASGLEAGSLAMSPALAATTAVSLAAAHVGWTVSANALVQKAADADGQRVTFDKGTMADDAKAWPVYFPLAPGVARLAWATEIWGDPDAFLVVVDAEDGTVLFRKNLTNYQTQSATYNIYNDDSPAPMSPSTTSPGSGTQAPFIPRTTFTLIGNEAPNTFNNLGWMTDGTNETDGNNVRAGLNLVTPDGIEATVVGTARTFNFSYNPQTEDPSTAAYRSGEVTDMFYWTNKYHDSLYVLGFNEVARNFQNNNFGRGGLGADKVKAEGQDFSGTNNANFSTPPDGSQGRMQMYIFTGPTPHRTSAIEHDVLLHELTHGTSNRLHNNATGLNSQLSVGMGEGWSDFYARALLSSAAEDPNGIYSTGGWVTNQIDVGFVDNYYYGIRRFPYTVKTTVGANGKPHNPLTLNDIDPLQINLSDGAFAPAFVGAAFEVHNIGELWAMALLEVRARFINRLGFNVGNQRILQFVTDGMKLNPLNPTLLQGRDSILAAAAAGGGTAADTADIWAGFAARGMGVLATYNQITFTAAENFNVPGVPLPSVSINDVSVTEGNVGQKTATFTLTLANPSSMLSDARVTWRTEDGTATAPGQTLTKFGPISVPASASTTAASPYPVNVSVDLPPNPIGHVRVRLNSVTHTWPSDMDVMLVGPGGQKVMLMSDAGASFPISGVDLTFDDGAPRMPQVSPLATGTYAPTDFEPGDILAAPAPPGPYGTSLSVFNGTNPNGIWSLYVSDDFPPADFGTIGSVTLIFSTLTDDYIPASGQVVFPLGGATTQTVNVTINGEPFPEPHEAFFVNLSTPVGVAITDAQGVGTILNDDGITLPTVVTGVATGITSTGATLNGTVNPNGDATNAWFEYGPTISYGSITGPQIMGAGNSVLPIGGGVISGLTCNTTYHFRATAINIGGSTPGSDASFATSPCTPPTVTTGFPTNFTATGAALNGSANPNGNATTAWFEYGATLAYGSTTPVQALGAGGIVLPIGGGTISGLTCDAIYHYRATAMNVNGTTNGPDRTFSPPCAGTLNPSLLAVANDTSALVVYNAATLAAVATIPVPSNFNFDVAVMPNQSLAFAARADGVWVIDLTQSPPVLAAGLNPIPTPAGMPFVEDLSLTRDGQFLVATDGSTTSPIAVINTATRAVVGTTSVLGDHNSVEVCDNGSVLVTSVLTGINSIRRLTISSTGALTDTGQSLALPGAGPNSTVCASGGTVGVVVDLTGDLRSFLINGMTPIATQPLPGTNFGLNVAISSDGTKVFGRRSSDFLTAYAFNPATGAFGGQLWSTNVGAAQAFYGVDQIALDPVGRRVYASAAGYVLSLNASTGVLNGGAAAIFPTGIAVRRGTPPIGDYDGDGKADIDLFRASTGTWYVKQSGANYSTFLIQSFGLATDIPVAGDYDGDGKADLAVYRPSNGTWYVLKSSTNFTTALIQAWGLNTDIPVPGDYDGDGKTDLGLFRPSTATWYVLLSSNNYSTFIIQAWGLGTDIPLPGDYDGDGKADLGLYRPSNGTWYVLKSSTNFGTAIIQSWGLNTDIAVPGDYDGDGKMDHAVFRPSTGVWYLLQSSTNYTTFVSQSWGLGTDIAVPGDYDGDGKTDLGLYRPSTGTWYLLSSGSNYTTFIGQTWGLGTDTPLLRRQ